MVWEDCTCESNSRIQVVTAAARQIWDPFLYSLSLSSVSTLFLDLTLSLNNAASRIAGDSTHKTGKVAGPGYESVPQ